MYVGVEVQVELSDLSIDTRRNVSPNCMLPSAIQCHRVSLDL